MKIITSPSEIDRFLPAKWADSFNARKKALEVYLKDGGVIKIGEVKNEWPRLIYPTKEKLEKEIKDVEKELDSVERRLELARKRLDDLKQTPGKTLKVLFDPLFWKHKVRLLTDEEYREVFELVRPPVHLIHRPEWKKRMDLFLKSDEYRERLKEARLSEIGKRREFLENEVEKRMEFSRSVVENLIEKLEKKRKELKERLSALKVLLSWAKAS